MLELKPDHAWEPIICLSGDHFFLTVPIVNCVATLQIDGFHSSILCGLHPLLPVGVFAARMYGALCSTGIFPLDDGIELHAFASLEALPCVWPMPFLLGLHSLTG